MINQPEVNTPKPSEDKLHPAIDELNDDSKMKSSGRHVAGVPNQPIVSVNPTTSKPTSWEDKKASYHKLNDISDEILNTDNTLSNYDVDIDVGDGFLIPVEPNQTLDQVVLKANKQVHQLNEYYSVFAVNDEGERILDMIMTEEIKRNADKTIQLNDQGKPITGANQGFIPRRIQIRQYVCKGVTQNDKFPEDGALIVRVF